MIRDPSGFRRHLTFDELLAREKAEEKAELSNPAPGIYREATRLVLSPFWERLYEGLEEEPSATAVPVFPHER